MIFTMALMITGLIFLDADLAGQVTGRQATQQKRIRQGVASGELTRCEAGILKREQRHIQRQKRKAWSNGMLTPGERTRFKQNQNYSNRHSYRLKHNDIRG